MPIFSDYSRCYNLLYADKDYAAEAAYVARHIRRVSPEAQSILELGCGTGRHAHHFASHGFNLHGVDLSQEMIEVAQSNHHPADRDVVYLEAETGALYLEKPEDVRRYSLMIDYLRAQALGPA